jgi:putative heme-binding domain-containing protein
MLRSSVNLNPCSFSARSVAVIAVLACLASDRARSVAAENPAPDSPLVKLLKSGRVPEARLSTIIEMIGKRGTASDLTYLYERALSPSELAPLLRAKVLEMLAQAAANRNLRPVRDLDKLVPLLRASSSRSDIGLVMPATRLAGLWKLESAADALAGLAGSPSVNDALRAEAIDALAAIGGTVGRSRIEALVGIDQPVGTRLPAVAALAALDLEAAATKAAEILAQPAPPAGDLTRLIGAFLNRQRGGEALAAALARLAVPADSARLALRAVYALGRPDPALVAALSRAAGISSETKPLSPRELNELVADVSTKGDPTRGEGIFRRTDLNCMSCHSLSKAGGDVGPDLSALGQTSPPDYIINSILDPDQAIKEQYHTLLVLTSVGQVFQGIVTDKDEQRIVLKEATGAPRVVPVAQIEDEKPGGSLMPKGLANLMTRSEFVDLVRFLSELGKPGPFAIPATLAIQRWKVLKPVPESLACSVPDPDLFRDQVLRAGPDHWVSVYAKVAGSMPLDELGSATRREILYLQGEINVTVTGAVRFQVDSPQGIRLWVDDHPAPEGAQSVTQSLAPGTHSITVRVDMQARKTREIKVEVDKPAGSAAEFTIVGGR